MNEVVIMFENGASMREIRNYMESKQAGITRHMIQDVADRIGIPVDEFKFDTGDSFGETRFQRPKSTFGLIVAATIGLLVLYRRDVAKVRKQLRINSTIGGIQIGKKFFGKYTKAVTQKAKDKLLNVRIGDILNGAFRTKLFRRSGMLSSRYLRNEAMHAGNVVRQKRAELKGNQYVYIPKTAHGHMDNCSAYEGRFWEIGSIPLPPYHVNCKHVAHYLDKLPEHQRTSSPEVARKTFDRLTWKPKPKK
jgi:hypothetical protein